MSRGFVKEGDQEQVPTIAPLPPLPEGVANHVTQDGLDELRDRLAAAENQYSVSTDYVGRNLAMARIKQLGERIASAVVFEQSKVDHNTVGFGAWVSLDNGLTLRITGVDQADSDRGMVSFLSPLAKALTGHRVGESVEIVMPQGVERVVVEVVSYTELATTPLVQKRSSRQKNIQLSAEVDAPTVQSQKAVDMGIVPEQPIRQLEQPIKPQPRREDESETVPLVNERGIIVGRAQRHEVHNGSKLLHPVVHLHVVNEKGEIYLQKRPSWKKIQSNRWDTAVGGHMAFGERPEAALARETQEELGLKADSYQARLVKRYVFESAVERELIYVFVARYGGAIVPSDETDGGEFFTPERIEAQLGKKFFTPNFESEYKMLKNILFL